MKKTERGFKIYSEFKDTYRNTIRVQESSSAEGARCWVFAYYPDGSMFSINPNSGECFTASPHLSPGQARRLAKALLKFADSE